MQSMWWTYCLLVLILGKSRSVFADVEVSVIKGTDRTDMQDLLDLNNTYSQCPANPSAHGIYTVQVGALEPFEVFCDSMLAGPGWTVISRRTNGELHFFRSWAEYKVGFGSITGNFFIGLDKLHAITKAQPQELYIHLEDFEGNKRYAHYDVFHIESENESYLLSKLGTYTGDAGNSMTKSVNQKFTTYDRDNDGVSGNCAVFRMGPWWHKDCTYANLFAMYVNGTVASMQQKGIFWYYWHGDTYSLKVTQMMLRPKCTCSSIKKETNNFN